MKNKKEVFDNEETASAVVPKKNGLVNFIKRNYLKLGVGLILLFLVLNYFVFPKEKVLEYDSVIVKKQDLVQEVNVTGHLRPYEQVDLGFERGGKITFVGVKVGDHVLTGAELMKVDKTDLLADMASAQASVNASAAGVRSSEVGVTLARIEVDSDVLGVSTQKAQLDEKAAYLDVEKARLDDVKSPITDQELTLSEVNVANAEITVKDAELNLQNTIDKAKNDLDNWYDLALADLGEALDASISALLTITEIQYDHFSGATQDAVKIDRQKADAMSALFDEKNGGRYSETAISNLDGGLVERLVDVNDDTTYDELDELIADFKKALSEVDEALDVIPEGSKLSSSQISELSSQKLSITNQITYLTDRANSISSQKVTNQNNIISAESSLNEANSALLIAENEFLVKDQGATPEKIAVQEAQIKQAEATYGIQLTNVLKSENDVAFPRAKVSQAQASLAGDQAQYNRSKADVQAINAEIDKTIISAPIDGVISMQEGGEGEIAPTNTPVITIISEGHFKIEAFIPEVDIAKIKLGDKSKFTLDALTEDEVFDAEVITIDPAETIIEGVTTYKVTLEFFTEDERIRSNMTANIDIMTAKHENVIAVLSRSIIETNGDKYVRVVRNGEIVEVDVKTGLIGNDGMVEIIEGLEEGDEVITFIKD